LEIWRFVTTKTAQVTEVTVLISRGQWLTLRCRNILGNIQNLSHMKVRRTPSSEVRLCSLEKHYYHPAWLVI
jgi:hypothetical protein